MFSQIDTKQKTLDQLYKNYEKLGGIGTGGCNVDIYRCNNVYKFVLTDTDNVHTSIYMWREEKK